LQKKPQKHFDPGALPSGGAPCRIKGCAPTRINPAQSTCKSTVPADAELPTLPISQATCAIVSSGERSAVYRSVLPSANAGTPRDQLPTIAVVAGSNSLTAPTIQILFDVQAGDVATMTMTSGSKLAKDKTVLF
jgi:hypothetical protein